MISPHLHLVTSALLEQERTTVTSPGTTPAAESCELQRVHAELDAALEELDFLREQLRSTTAFFAHRLELEHARLDSLLPQAR